MSENPLLYNTVHCRKAPAEIQILQIKIVSHKLAAVCAHMHMYLHVCLFKCVQRPLWMASCVSLCVLNTLNTEAFNIKAPRGFKCTETFQLYV